MEGLKEYFKVLQSPIPCFPILSTLLWYVFTTNNLILIHYWRMKSVLPELLIFYPMFFCSRISTRITYSLSHLLSFILALTLFRLSLFLMTLRISSTSQAFVEYSSIWICLTSSSWLYRSYESWKEDYRGKVLFSSHCIKGTCY